MRSATTAIGKGCGQWPKRYRSPNSKHGYSLSPLTIVSRPPRDCSSVRQGSCLSRIGSAASAGSAPTPGAGSRERLASDESHRAPHHLATRRRSADQPSASAPAEPGWAGRDELRGNPRRLPRSPAERAGTTSATGVADRWSGAARTRSGARGHRERGSSLRAGLRGVDRRRGAGGTRCPVVGGTTSRSRQRSGRGDTLEQVCGTSPLRLRSARAEQGVLHLHWWGCRQRRCYECPIAQLVTGITASEPALPGAQEGRAASS
jgi:hypothetical protein